MYRAYKDNPQVAIYFIYIREAHPAEQKRKNDTKKIAKHKTIDDRINAALKCGEGLKLSVPFLIDGIDAKVQSAYRAAFACTTVVDLEGKIAFHSRGPWGTQPDKAETAVKKLLAAQEK